MERDPDFYERLYLVVTEEADANGDLALTAASAMALYPPLADYVDPIWTIQRDLREIGETCTAISFLRGHIGGPKEKKARESMRRFARKLADTHYKRQNALIELRLRLDQVAGVEPPAVSAAQDSLAEPLGEIA